MIPASVNPYLHILSLIWLGGDCFPCIVTKGDGDKHVGKQEL